MLTSPLLTRSNSGVLLWCICLFVFVAMPTRFLIGAVDSVSKVADGELRACQIVTVDQAWAVGDRGLILATNDAGKTWAVQHQRSEATLYAICFANDRKGLVLGGTIDPYSHRSRGVIFLTMDGGRNWQPIPCNLPRLTGAQLLGKDHILAWGDWSSLYQSALFESLDGGQSWTARPTPCSHIQSAAIGPNGKLVLIDRVGKIHQSLDGIEYQPIRLPVTPFDPLRFCKYIAGTWWLGGDAGQLYRSTDGAYWKPIVVPGSETDRRLYSFKDITGFRKSIWLVGQPGSVVWASEDRGETWTVRETRNPTTINSISAFDGDVLLACGPLATIRASRNGGKAWWAQHQSGTRNSILNIASTSSSVAWDLMAQVTLESKRHASVMVLHDQCIEERIGYSPELAARFDVAAKSIGLDQAIVQTSLPVGNLVSGVRLSDLEYYGREPNSDAELESSLIVRCIALAIRSARPDIVVCNCIETGNSLESKSARAIEIASRLAGRKDFHLFSESSSIVDEAWQPQRILIRGTKPSRLSYSPAMLLKSSNVVLGSAIAGIKPLMDVQGYSSPQEPKYSYRILGSKSGSLSDPFEGVLLDPATQMNERNRIASKLPLLNAAIQLLDWKQVLDSEHGNPLTQDRVWESNLKTLAKELSFETVSPVLMDIAVQSRRSGDWQRWYSALELLLEKDSSHSAAEGAFWELMAHTGSAEVQRVIESQSKQIEGRFQMDQNGAVGTVQQASPFAKQEHESSPIQQVAFSSPVRRIPIATNRDLVEFKRLLSKWPQSMQPRRSEPRWGWLITSRYRAMQKRNDGAMGTANMNQSPSVFWPLLSDQVPAWNQVGKVERSIGKANELKGMSIPLQLSASPIAPWTWVENRPFLDGIADEEFWKTATEIELRDPWSDNSAGKTSIRFARDDEHLYLFSKSPKMATRSNAKPIPVSKEKRRDGITNDSDHIKLRLDLDRDYSSWFEFGWSVSGETSDACNDMPFWNPTWWVAMSNDSTSWTAEIAIPLEEITVSKGSAPIDWTNEVWAINAVRNIPSVATHSISPSISDRMTVDEWVHLDLKQP